MAHVDFALPAREELRFPDDRPDPSSREMAALKRAVRNLNDSTGSRHTVSFEPTRCIDITGEARPAVGSYVVHHGERCRVKDQFFSSVDGAREYASVEGEGTIRVTRPDLLAFVDGSYVPTQLFEDGEVMEAFGTAYVVRRTEVVAGEYIIHCYKADENVHITLPDPDNQYASLKINPAEFDRVVAESPYKIGALIGDPVRRIVTAPEFTMGAPDEEGKVRVTVAFHYAGFDAIELIQDRTSNTVQALFNYINDEGTICPTSGSLSDMRQRPIAFTRQADGDGVWNWMLEAEGVIEAIHRFAIYMLIPRCLIERELVVSVATQYFDGVFRPAALTYLNSPYMQAYREYRTGQDAAAGIDEPSRLRVGGLAAARAMTREEVREHRLARFGQGATAAEDALPAASHEEDEESFESQYDEMLRVLDLARHMQDAGEKYISTPDRFDAVAEMIVNFLPDDLLGALPDEGAVDTALNSVQARFQLILEAYKIAQDEIDGDYSSLYINWIVEPLFALIEATAIILSGFTAQTVVFSRGTKVPDSNVISHIEAFHRNMNPEFYAEEAAEEE